MKDRYYAVGNYYQGTVMDAERTVPVCTVNMAVPGAQTQSALDGAQYIANLLNADLVIREWHTTCARCGHAWPLHGTMDCQGWMPKGPHDVRHPKCACTSFVRRDEGKS